MYAFIKGKVFSVSGNTVVIDCNGVGYDIYSTSTLLEKASNTPKGEDLLVNTFLQVKEDDMVLFGFYSNEEKNLFTKLISVSGVGAKTGIAILSHMRIDQLMLAIVTGDSIALSSVKGIGKKTAERIILELKEKIESISIESKSLPTMPTFSNAENEAVDALMALGLTKSESVQAVNKALNSGANKFDDIIAKALKSLHE